MIRCEVMTRLLPSIRSEVTRELRNKYGLTQEEIANKLNVTQGAVSQYLIKRRGKNIVSPELKKAIKQLAREIMNGKDFETEVCKICKKLDILNL